jgi:hypothetical protein
MVCDGIDSSHGNLKPGLGEDLRPFGGGRGERGDIRKRVSRCVAFQALVSTNGRMAESVRRARFAQRSGTVRFRSFACTGVDWDEKVNTFRAERSERQGGFTTTHPTRRKVGLTRNMISLFVCDVPSSLHPLALGYALVQSDAFLDEACTIGVFTALSESAKLVDICLCGNAYGIIRSIKHDTVWIEDRWWSRPTCYPDDC